MSKEKIIIPLDVENVEKAVVLVEQLKDDVGAFKIGLELFNSAGIEIFDIISKAGACKIFYDAKFMDIPNTVAGAMRAVVKHNLWLVNVHCTGGAEMMRAAKKAAVEKSNELGIDPPKVIGVTILTSIDQQTLNLEIRVPGSVEDQVVHLAKLAKECGLDGVVASPLEIEAIRVACGSDFMIVTPGVRPAGSYAADQKRVMTPAEAVKKGADYLVIGRPITSAPDPVEAARVIAAEMG